MEPAVLFDAVTKSYGRQAVLRGLTFRVGSGEVYCLLGPNGAGKTTALNIATGQVLASTGRVRVLGRDPARDPRGVLGETGVVAAGARGLWWRLTGEENMLRYALLQHVEPRTARRRTAELLESFGLERHARKLAGLYSTGMRVRLSLARALVHDPRLVVMDEPWAGLDPEGQVETAGTIRELAASRGKTILVASHDLPRVEAVAGRIGVVSDGRLLAEGTPAELLALVPFAYAVRACGPSDQRGEAEEERFAALAPALERVRGLLAESSSGVEIRHRRLEDVYFHLRTQAAAERAGRAPTASGGRAGREATER